MARETSMIKRLYSFIGSAVAVLAGFAWMNGTTLQQWLQSSNLPQSLPQILNVITQEVSHQAPPPQQQATIRVASFNIQVFGEKKLSNSNVTSKLVQICRHFDVIAIQEVRSDQQTILPQFISMLNADGSSYNYVIGPRLGRTDSKEQYAFVYDQSSIEVDRNQLYTIDDPDDLLQREPLVGWFRARGPNPNEAFTFSLVTVHTTPDPPRVLQGELNVLDDVFLAVRNDGRNEDDVIMLGDFNANHLQLGELGQVPGIACVIGDMRDSSGRTVPIPTNTLQTKQYDNILFDARATTEFAGKAGVFNFAQEYGLSQEDAKWISDHFPVWAEFSVYEGGPNMVAGMGANNR